MNFPFQHLPAQGGYQFRREPGQLQSSHQLKQDDEFDHLVWYVVALFIPFVLYAIAYSSKRHILVKLLLVAVETLRSASALIYLVT